MTVGPNLVQRAPSPDGHESVEEAERGGGGEHLDAGGANPSGQLPGLAGAVAGQHRPAQLRAVVHQDDVAADLGGAQSRGHAGDATAHHQHVGVPSPILGAPVAVSLVAGQAAEAGGAPEHFLPQRPQAPRPDEGLVVEAGRSQPATEEVGGAHRVEAQRGLCVHVAHLHPRAHRLRAGADAGPAIHLDQAVGALAGATEQAARPVVLEAAREHAPAGGVQGRANRVALERLDPLAVEAELDRAAAAYAFVRAGGEAVAQCSGSPTQLTSLVVVSRSARNQARQPER